LKLVNQPASIDGGQLLFFKMIQNEDFAFHHSPDLTIKHHVTLDISNETRGVSFSKRLYFNK
jgi:hypothetical protein